MPAVTESSSSRKGKTFAINDINQRLTDFVRNELVSLWDDLFNAQQRAANGEWSIECESFGERIAAASNLVGAVDWNEIGLPLVTSGWFQAMSRRVGVAHPRFPSGEEMAQLFEDHPEHAHMRDDVVQAIRRMERP
jgi:hypothetical protein